MKSRIYKFGGDNVGPFGGRHNCIRGRGCFFRRIKGCCQVRVHDIHTVAERNREDDRRNIMRFIERWCDTSSKTCLS